MFWNKYLWPAIILAALVAILNWVGQANNYYYTISWYDWPMHFLGGATIAALTLWLATFLNISQLKPLLKVRNLVLFVFAVGISWEIFELAFHLTVYTDVGYVWDTTHDLAMDVLGAITVAYVL